MKNNILHPIIAVIIGLLGGYLLFENSSGNDSQMTDDHNHLEAPTSHMWTCSMHPQISQPETGDCPICGMDLIPTETTTNGLSINEIKMSKNAMALANIQTSIVGNALTNDNDNVLFLSGKISENKDQTATMPAHFDGRIEKIYVTSLGQQVKKGQLIAEIYSPSLVAAQQELITVSRNKETQPKLYASVRNKFKNLNIHGNILDRIENTGEVISNFPVHSHVNGIVTEISLNVGAHVMDGMPIFKVSNLSSVWASFDAYENQISKLKKGQKIKVIANAYADKEFDAVISFIDPVLNNKTRTVIIRTTLKNTNKLLKPGMFVTGEIKGLSLSKKETLNIPSSAILWTGKRSLVYIKTNPNEAIFEMRDVTLGPRNGDTYQVTSGLENGDEIVTNGTFTVDAAAQLQGKKSMMNKKTEEITLDISMKMKLPTDFQKGFENTLPSYIKMNAAFIKGIPQEVGSFAEAILHKLETLSINNLTNTQEKHLLLILKKLTAITVTQDLKKQREHAVELNENMVALVLNITKPINTLYIQKCPMVDNNRGALWLSTEKEIKNPYYGDSMLTCGSIIKTIK